MKSFINWILGLGFLGEVGEWLNGKKTILGALALLLYVLEIAPNVFPQCTMCPQIAEGLQQLLGWIGVVLTPIGITHKLVKKGDE